MELAWLVVRSRFKRIVLIQNWEGWSRFQDGAGASMWQLSSNNFRRPDPPEHCCCFRGALDWAGTLTSAYAAVIKWSRLIRASPKRRLLPDRGSIKSRPSTARNPQGTPLPKDLLRELLHLPFTFSLSWAFSQFIGHNFWKYYAGHHRDVESEENEDLHEEDRILESDKNEDVHEQEEARKRRRIKNSWINSYTIVVCLLPLCHQ